jgi:hypothetical protein
MTDQLLRMIFPASLSLSLFILIWAQTKVWCFTAKFENRSCLRLPHTCETAQPPCALCAVSMIGFTMSGRLQRAIFGLDGDKSFMHYYCQIWKNFQAYLRQRSNSSLTISSLKFFFCHPLPLVAIVDGIPIIVIGPWPWFVMVCPGEQKQSLCYLRLPLPSPCPHIRLLWLQPVVQLLDDISSGISTILWCFSLCNCTFTALFSPVIFNFIWRLNSRRHLQQIQRLPRPP